MIILTLLRSCYNCLDPQRYPFRESRRNQVGSLGSKERESGTSCDWGLNLLIVPSHSLPINSFGPPASRAVTQETET